MTATLRDVAREAGVSIRTVSRVVNNKAEIAAETRQRVLAVIHRLQYRPNVLARSLVSGKTRSVAVVIPQITDPFYPEFVQGVESVVRQDDYHVFLSNTDEDPIQEYKTLEALAGKQVEGVILCGTRMSDEQLLQANQLHRLVVVTSRPPAGLSTVNVQEEAGLATITSHLIQLGHRHIGHIARVQHGRAARRDGYRSALQAHGLSTPDSYIEHISGAYIESGYSALQRLLEREPQLTAITCYNDLVAIGALQACAALGRAVPGDIAVVGFDDIQLASLVQPALTTMHVPRFRLGQMATEQLMALLHGNANGISAGDQIGQLATELIIRASCGGSQ
ncbi:MAG: LacI family DNA-binding transcriptional regulator [Caldilineaceae bacterium]